MSDAARDRIPENEHWGWLQRSLGRENKHYPMVSGASAVVLFLLFLSRLRTTQNLLDTCTILVPTLMCIAFALERRAPWLLAGARILVVVLLLVLVGTAILGSLGYLPK